MLDNAVLYNEEIASKCIYGSDFVKEILGVEYNHHNVYSAPYKTNMSTRKLEGYIRLSKTRKFYQQNPVLFIKHFFNIQLLDSQAYIMMEAWNKPQILIVASRAYGKSLWIVLFCMAKQMLSSDPWTCYVASGSSQQSATTFKKLEDIANDRISSMLNSSGYIFKAEVEVPMGSGDGFSHNPSGFEYKLHNGSFLKTLNSNVDRNRGARAVCVCFDECGFLDEDLIQVYQAFCAVDKDFKTGVNDDGTGFDNVRLNALPREIPSQLIYVSSASSTDTEFYRMYREFSKKMIAGDPNYFVANIDCDLVMSPTICGKKIKPALTQEKIDVALATNFEKARREYYCEFTTDAGVNAIIRRSTIARNEELRKPLLYNDTGDKKFIITYDPSRLRDNAVILVGELYDNSSKKDSSDLEVRLVNSINLIDIEKKTKTPMTIPNQVKELRRIILEYNNGGDEFYSNIVAVLLDQGAGGQASAISDLLMQDWTDDAGVTHKGIIDKEYSSEYVKRFPSAVNKLKMMIPSAYKSEMYEALIQMLDENHIKFTSEYDNKGYLTFVDIDKEEYEKQKKKLMAKYSKKKLTESQMADLINNELSKSQNLTTKIEKLSIQEELALSGIDATKEELVNMIRIRRDSGKDSFELAPEKRSRLHDDRAYTAAMMAWELKEQRRNHVMNKPRKKVKDIADLLMKQTKVSTRKVSMFD